MPSDHSFLAIDFETANQSRNSACSIGLVKIENGRVTHTDHQLIKPPTLEFDSRNVSIHGITALRVLFKPRFKKVWPTIWPHFQDTWVVAHNAAFDLFVLRDSLDHYRLPVPPINYFCSVQVAQKAWPKLRNHKLDTVAKILNIKFKHHDALADAQACAAVVVAAMEVLEADTIEELFAVTRMREKQLETKREIASVEKYPWEERDWRPWVGRKSLAECNEMYKVGKYEEAEEALLHNIKLGEDEQKKYGDPYGSPTGFFKRLAIMYRKLGRYDDEVALLERFLEFHTDPHYIDEKIVRRLDKARELQMRNNSDI